MRSVRESSDSLTYEINKANESFLSRSIPYLIYSMFLIPFTFGCMISLFSYNKPILSFYPHEFQREYDINNIIWSFTLALFPLGGWIGTYLSSFLGNKYSRSTSTKFFIILGIIGSLFHALSYATKFYALLILSRFFHGLGSGGAMNIGVLYFCEIIPPERNMLVGAIIQPVINAGIFWSSLFSLESLCSGKWLAANIFLLVILVICLLVLFLLPQSPYYTFLKTGNVVETSIILSKLRNKPIKDVQDELDIIIRKKDDISTISSVSMTEFLGDKRLRGAIIITTLIAVFQQISGINIVIFFCSKFIEETGYNQPDVGNLFMFSIFLIGSILFMFVLPTSESKLTMVIGFCSMSIAFSMAAISITFKLNPFVGVFYLSLFLFWFQSGPGPKMWSYFNETFPLQYQEAARGYLTFCNCLANFLMTFIYPLILYRIHRYAFGMFGTFNFFFGLILQIFMIKSFNKTSDQIIEDYEKKFAFLK